MFYLVLGFLVLRAGGGLAFWIFEKALGLITELGEKFPESL